MRTTQINKDTRPDLFFLPTDKLVDGKTIPVLDVEEKPTGEVEKEYVLTAEVDKTSFIDYDILKRKSAKGIAETRTYNDNSEIWHEIDGQKYKVAHQEVFLEYFEKEKWLRSKATQTLDPTSLADSGDVVTAVLDSDTGKQEFTVMKKGFTVRCVWAIDRYDAYKDCFDDLKLDYSDYKGNVEDSGWIEDRRTITFEPKGVDDKLIVDPYLSVATTSTTITVTFDSGDIVVWTIADDNAVLVENLPSRAVIHEDYFRWTIYGEYLVRWQHDTGASSTGAAFDGGNSHCTDANKAQIGAYNYYFYPASSANNTAKTTLAAELAAMGTDITTVGSPVTDYNIPATIDTTSGFRADGAFVMEGNKPLDSSSALFPSIVSYLDIQEQPFGWHDLKEVETLADVVGTSLFTLTEVSGSVTQSQGIGTDGTNWYVFLTDRVIKYDASWEVLYSNLDPFANTSGSLNHVGDGFYYADKVYVPCSLWTGTETTAASIVVLDADDLTYLTHYEVTTDNTGCGLSSICLSADGTEIYGVTYLSTGDDAVHVWNLTGTAQTTLTLSQAITGIQGIAYQEGYYWLTSVGVSRNDILKFTESLVLSEVLTPELQSDVTHIEGLCFKDSILYICDSGELLYTITLTRETTFFAYHNEPFKIITTPPDSGCLYFNQLTPKEFYNYNAVIDNLTTANDWEAWIYATGVLAWRINAASKCEYTLPTADMAYDIAFMWEKSGTDVTIKLGVDGIVRDSVTQTWYAAPALYLNGANASNDEGYHVYDDIVLFDKSLSDVELLSLHNNFSLLRSTYIAGKVTMDRDRALFAMVIDGDHYKTGDPGSPTDHLVTRLKCGDDAASATIVADTGTDANWEAQSDGGDRNTSTSGDSVDGAGGSALDTQNGTAYIDMSLTGHANSFFKLGTIKICNQPQFSYDDAADQTLFHVYIDANNYLLCWYDAGNDRFEFTVAWGGTTATVNLAAHTADGTLQQFNSIWCAWNSDNDFLTVYNGVETDSDTNTGTPSASNPTKFTIGAMQDRSLPGDFIIDDVVTLDGQRTNYGSFIDGGIIHSEEYDRAHSDITFFWDGSDCTSSNVQIGGVQGTKGGSDGTFETSGGHQTDDYLDTAGTAELHFSVTTEDIIDFGKGSIGIWVNIQTIGDGDAIFGVGDADDHIQAVLDASGNVDVTYRSASTSEIITGDIALVVDTDYYILITWAEGDQVHCYIDGVENGTAQDIANAYEGATSDVIYFGADYAGANLLDAYFDTVTITSSPSTPAVPTINGLPILYPHVKGEIA